MAIPAIFNSSFVLASILFFVLPFTIYHVSTALFFRKVRSRSKYKIPPTVPYRIPGLFHGASILLQGRPAFFTQIIKKYGDFVPFKVKTGFNSYVIVRDPHHVNAVLASNGMVPQGVHVELFNEVFGAPKEATLLVHSQTSRKKEDDLDYAHKILPQNYLSGAHLDAMVERYASTLSRNLSEKMFQEKTWTELEDLWTFFRNEITKVLVETIYGSGLLKTYPRIVRDFWEFDSNIENVKRKVPRFLAPKAYAARDRLLEQTEKWLQSLESATESEKGRGEDTGWDASKGSLFFQKRDEALANVGSIGHRARAAEVLALLHQCNAEVAPSALWHIIEALRDDALKKKLSREIDACRKASRERYNIKELASSPIFKAMAAEVARLRIASCVIRKAEQSDVKLGDDWLIREGTSAMVFSRDVSLNNPIWSERWPRARVPLEQFSVERFPIADPRLKAKSDVDGEYRGKFNTGDANDLLIAFGAGSHVCPGRHFARAVQAATLAVLLGEYEIQLSDPEPTEQMMPPVDGDIFGTIKPLGPLRMRLRKRRTR